MSADASTSTSASAASQPARPISLYDEVVKIYTDAAAQRAIDFDRSVRDAVRTAARDQDVDLANGGELTISATMISGKPNDVLPPEKAGRAVALLRGEGFIANVSASRTIVYVELHGLPRDLKVSK